MTIVDNPDISAAGTDIDLERQRALAKARARAKALELEGGEPPKSASQSFADNVTAPFNKGLIDMASLPTDAVNAGLRLVQWGADKPYQLPNGLREWGNYLNLTATQGQEAEGLVPKSMEILGGSVIPAAGMTKKGQMLAEELPFLQEGFGTVKSAVTNMLKSMGSSPKAALVADVAGSAGAGAGGTITEKFTDNQALILTGELLGGFSPAGLVAVPSLVSRTKIMGAWYDTLMKHLVPFTKEGARPRAAERLRGLSPDPEAEAALISDNSKLSPARQTGNPKLIALEKRILAESPAMADDYAKELEAARKELTELALSFGGKGDRTRELLKDGQAYLESLIDIRAAQAAAELDAAVANLSSGATVRDISRQARKILGEAYDDALTQEKELWRAIPDGPASVTNAQESLARIRGTRSLDDDPADIPQWLVARLSDEVPESTMVALGKAGALNPDGSIKESFLPQLIEQGVIVPRKRTFRDLQALRKRILADVRAERAKDAPNRNKIRILNQIANGDPETGAKGLVDDMEATGLEGVKAARAFSKRLNERFRQGNVGRMLGYENTGGLSTDPADTLGVLLGGKSPITAVEQFLKASPESAPIVEDFFKTQFLSQVTRNGKISRGAYDTFMRKWEQRGLFEVFPKLKEQFSNIVDLDSGATALATDAAKVRTFSYKTGQDAAKLYLGADPGDEMRVILRSRNSAAVAESVAKQVSHDVDAARGLKTSFTEELMNQSTISRNVDGIEHDFVSGHKLGKMLSQYRSTAKALGMTDEEVGRLDFVADQLAKAGINPSQIPGDVLSDEPIFALKLIAQYIGASEGGKLGKTIGSGLVMAQAFSKRMVYMLRQVTGGTARQLLVDSVNDKELYRALMTNTQMPKLRQEAAAAKLDAWLVSVGVQTVPFPDPNQEQPKQ